MKACHNCMHWPVCNMREDDNACGYYKPQEKMRVKTITNGDKIHAMSDEELADVIANGVGCVLKAPHCMDDDCTPCILWWLKQPPKGE